MKLQFGLEITWYTLHLIIFGRHFHWERRIPPRTMARRIKEDGSLAVCLSILYIRQGWFREAHQRNAEPKSRWTDHETYITPVPAPRRHGGKGRIQLCDSHLDERDRAFAKNALGLFEFGGDVKAPIVGHVGSQRDSDGENCSWPEKKEQSCA